MGLRGVRYKHHEVIALCNKFSIRLQTVSASFPILPNSPPYKIPNLHKNILQRPHLRRYPILPRIDSFCNLINHR